MQPNFESLAPQYAKWFDSMHVTRKSEIERTADRLIKLIPIYKDVEAETGVPAVWLAPINERESSSNFSTYLGNGDPLSRKTIHVPAGRGPFFGERAWRDGACDALHLDHIDRVKDTIGWTVESKMYEDELWNGFGPRFRGRVTGYLMAGTDIYTGGKYIADGVWSPSAIDTQLGTVPMYCALVERDPSLALPRYGVMVKSDTPSVPDSRPDFIRDASILQADLNKLVPGENLIIDGSIGRMTRLAIKHFQEKHGLDVDGIVGDETTRAIQSALQELH
ncbi:MAG TPA: peptidoglycan-binding protein [Xanthobacteraceae bacterium]|nr:peptidoglycan-binding protein [Xanthobacteraceae bacterium]